MDRFTNAVKLALDNKNWYGALASALTLPDICARLDNPVKPKGAPDTRYTTWATQWIEPKYTKFIGPTHTKKVFLSGADCYALRCAYLHAGQDDVSDDKKTALERFHFNAPPSIAHNNMFDGIVLQLDLGRFCMDIVAAVEEWADHVKGNDEVQSRMTSLISVEIGPHRMPF